MFRGARVGPKGFPSPPPTDRKTAPAVPTRSVVAIFRSKTGHRTSCFTRLFFPVMEGRSVGAVARWPFPAGGRIQTGGLGSLIQEYGRDIRQRSTDFSHRSRRVFCPSLRALLDLGGGHCTDVTGAGDRSAPAALFLFVELQRVGAGNSGSMGAPL